MRLERMLERSLARTDLPQGSRVHGARPQRYWMAERDAFVFDGLASGRLERARGL